MKILLYLIASLLLLFVILALRPIYNLSESDCLTVSGDVNWIGEGGPADIVFKLEDDPRRFYINRGEEAGLNIDSLRANLIGQRVEMKYADHWTPLDPRSKVRHIAELAHQGQILYTEIK